MKRVLRPWWWLLDYLYAGWRQLAAVFRREAPRSYAQGDPALSAIVLLPGVYETWLFLEPAAQRLNAAGHRVFAVPGLGINRRPIPDSAEIVRQRLAALATEHGIERCILLAHSKGGLIGKHLMLDAAAAVDTDASRQPPGGDHGACRHRDTVLRIDLCQVHALAHHPPLFPDRCRAALAQGAGIPQ